jgi:hypothetical protein
MRSPVRNSPSNARPTRDVTLASAVSTADDPLFNKKRVLFLTPLQQLWINCPIDGSGLPSPTDAGAERPGSSDRFNSPGSAIAGPVFKFIRTGSAGAIGGLRRRGGGTGPWGLCPISPAMPAFGLNG